VPIFTIMFARGMFLRGTDPDARRLTRVEIAFLLGAILLCRVLAIRACPIYDDAFITYRYARNLAQGAGLVFNPGAPWEPILGTTTPGYAVLLSLFSRVGIGLVQASRGVNLIADLATAWLILAAFDYRRIAGAAAVSCFAALPQLARISMGGMEAPLFAALALASAVALERGRVSLAGTLAALTCLVRPEGVLLLPVLGAARIRNPRALVRLSLPVLAIGAVSVILLCTTYGDPIPQSVHAKSQMHGGPAWSENLSRWRTILTQSFAPHAAYLPLVPLVFVGARATLTRRGGARCFSLFSLAITASYLAARPHTWGWYFYVPLVAWCLWLGLGIEVAAPWIARAAERVRARLLLRLLRPVTLASILIVVAAAVSFALPTRVPARVYEPMQRWASETSKLHPRATILASDIGAIAYTWTGTVLDSEGLTWPEALRYQHPTAMIEAMQPDYVLLVAERPRVEHFRSEDRVRRLYVPMARFSASGETELEPELDRVSPTWVQDYLVYKRVGL
jgi:hypothetical protein